MESPSASDERRTKHSPVLTLPTEMVAEIFVHFLPVYPLCPPLVGLESPALLTQICHPWREIALATPVLWRAISLSFDRNSSFEHQVSSFEHQVEISDSWLGRSRSLPLSIRVDAPTIPISPFFARIIPHRQRWEYLHIRCGVATFALELVAIGGPMPLLRCLDLSLAHATPDLVVVFKDTPLLNTALLNYYAAMLTLPWAQLTSLTLNTVSAYACFPVLRSACNLVHCDLFVARNYVDSQAPSVTLPRLTSLVFNVPNIDNFGLGGVLILPALRDLTTVDRIRNFVPIPTLTAFIARAGCTKLEEVCVADTSVVSEEQYRAAFPSIRAFTFIGR
ncbi:hypothetical protein C8F04DRAFT_1035070 [Mycena alexandri]|uniref:F-box domain-containing protein n=1 Tax=Mycena alexandri TaxID=1745969 RepID=A0AAD6T1Y5_9AGAR|nr:hypothetical protein C8F04DRAFT_1035070 [Mycena alexandri]